MAEERTFELPQGYRFAAGYAGIRKQRSDDLALMVSDQPASAAGVFTRNCVRAAPVDFSAESLRRSSGKAQLIVANAGNANCATPNMAAVAEATAAAAASLASAPPEHVLLASTGVIGESFGESVIPGELPRLWQALDRTQFEACARAIMTTDTVPKIRSCRIETEQGPVRLAGMAKGAGMIMPDMATMLSFVFTDADVEPSLLQSVLVSAVDQSFNCITVDSDTSTNDTVFLLANGGAGVRIDGERQEQFQNALNQLTRDLAIDIARDGEGSAKLAQITVTGPSELVGLKTIAMAIANSPLVKTALAGADPNWGRILGAAGKAGVPFNPLLADIYVNGVQVCKAGMRADFDEPAVQRSMEADDIQIEVCLSGGRGSSAVVWTCDFTESYIRINADYRT
ncbi:MAG: bifunctional glutamate N-acetyltransferase/amino-acid acetyltransferase ArgJ [Acidobacteriia bacterium]|nr:bifunctional glutamate N-acetyltransferase/amino-acid acetyltransferase ArgJ [Terriglobia bacterium]MYG05012.1 bifunctional glutamate N-acetyltransferase/amino-acid acetyltransferase ArgJ [Terriglobia bacterium]MYK11238.1 bifunctional glutamate N-acetyltransferase/amino-acid acetyltransferase ArgJ [Terriglobia bacterium]